MKSKSSGIYQIQSKIKPERFYIGSAVNIYRRWAAHHSYLTRNKHHSSKLQRHYDKYGEYDLIFTVLLNCQKDDLLKYEQEFIDIYNPFFNECKKAGSCLGIKRSKEICEKIRIQKIGKSTRWLGGKHSENTKRKISQSEMGKKVSTESRLKMSRSKKDIKLSEEHKQKISQSLKGNKRASTERTPETKKKISEGLKRAYKDGRRICNKDAQEADYEF